MRRDPSIQITNTRTRLNSYTDRAPAVKANREESAQNKPCHVQLQGTSSVPLDNSWQCCSTFCSLNTLE